MPRYDSIIIDSYNLAYRLYYATKPHTLANISNKIVYLSFVKKYIEHVDLLKDRLGNPGCQIYILFDNPDSRRQIKHTATEYSSTRIRYELDPEYKANRKKETKEFYNSIQFIKFLFSIRGKEYSTIRMPNLEADDLVKPLISEKCGEGTTLMVSTDMDWCRFLTPFVHIQMGGINDPITTVASFKEQYGFAPTEEKIILYKILFGDDSDNIRMVFPDIPKKVRQEIIQKYDSVHDIYLKPLPEFAEYHETFESHKKDVKVAYQLLSVIPVEKKKLKAYTVIGRRTIRLQEMVNKIFESYEEKKIPKKFSFGKLKCPRL